MRQVHDRNPRRDAQHHTLARANEIVGEPEVREETYGSHASSIKRENARRIELPRETNTPQPPNHPPQSRSHTRLRDGCTSTLNLSDSTLKVHVNFVADRHSGLISRYSVE